MPNSPSTLVASRCHVQHSNKDIHSAEDYMTYSVCLMIPSAPIDSFNSVVRSYRSPIRFRRSRQVDPSEDSDLPAYASGRESAGRRVGGDRGSEARTKEQETQKKQHSAKSETGIIDNKRCQWAWQRQWKGNSRTELPRTVGGSNSKGDTDSDNNVDN
ncbi:hypothetical protein ASPWEDRAFT_66476 [Aspergillus wentii DTO 134E9]|uniref:Uncharacterized protein n=1 Tax=Aspergillus wentii DTO 134E9 TaxID=1073089 RepID=A0A1L9RXK3_ASPWE|nr:uncharacterized protein ASPWEDRAFT_66476 [Aspergillus wentii DTO 134E9]OJJ39681.1 hypothetical protein ASPWEDRAFT_66476 [Aspergillus wentii DTO 134E9]